MYFFYINGIIMITFYTYNKWDKKGGDSVDLLNLEQDQIIQINNKEYYIASMIKYIETSSYWLEYEIVDRETSNRYFLNVELDSKAILYKKVKDTIKPNINITYEDEKYELDEKGNAKVETYFGITDVALNDAVEYYEYNNMTNKQKRLSIEVWKNETEVSIGEYISKANIKILDEFRF